MKGIRLKKEKGFSLIEAIVAIIILSIVSTSLVYSLINQQERTSYISSKLRVSAIASSLMNLEIASPGCGDVVGADIGYSSPSIHSPFSLQTCTINTNNGYFYPPSNGGNIVNQEPTPSECVNPPSPLPTSISLDQGSPSPWLCVKQGAATYFVQSYTSWSDPSPNQVCQVPPGSFAGPYTPKLLTRTVRIEGKLYGYVNSSYTLKQQTLARADSVSTNLSAPYAVVIAGVPQGDFVVLQLSNVTQLSSGVGNVPTATSEIMTAYPNAQGVASFPYLSPLANGGYVYYLASSLSSNSWGLPIPIVSPTPRSPTVCVNG